MNTLRERFIAKAVPRVKVVTPKFLGEPVEVWSLSLRERRDLIAASKGDDGEQDNARLEALVIIETVHDPATKERLWSKGDLDMLMSLSPEYLDELAMESMILNGLVLVAAQSEAEKN